MSIIFEGVDGTGKTTNARAFNKTYPTYIYVHNWAKPKKEIDIESEVNKEILLLSYTNNILFDRSFIISEYVYATVLERKTSVTFEYIANLAKLINMNGHTLKLFYFTNINDLHIPYDDNDRQLPLTALNDFYVDLFVNKVGIEKLILEDISERSNYVFS